MAGPLQMDCEEGAWSLVMACICLCPLSSVQEASCCLSRAGESREAPTAPEGVWPYSPELPWCLCLWGLQLQQGRTQHWSGPAPWAVLWVLAGDPWGASQDCPVIRF